MEKYTLEKAQEEAQNLKERVEFGSAKNYAEADKQNDAEHYQEMIRRCPTDDEAKRLSKGVRVNFHADTSFGIPGSLFPKKEELVKKSGSDRLIDLGSAYSLLGNEEGQLNLEQAGIREYIAVDLGIEDAGFKTRKPASEWMIKCMKKENSAYQEPEPNQRLKLKSLHKEILEALHSFPDGYGNTWMTGIERGNVIENYDEWSFAVLAELKRVVPENGFIYTDSGFVHETLIKCVTELKELFKVLLSIKHLEEERIWGNISGLSEAEKEQEIKRLEEQVRKYECPKDDPYAFLEKKYVIDASQVGFRIYLDKFWPWSETMIIINTKQKIESGESKSEDNQ